MDTVTFEHIYFTVINSVEHSLDQAEKFIQVRNSLAKSQPRGQEAFRDEQQQLLDRIDKLLVLLSENVSDSTLEENNVKMDDENFRDSYILPAISSIEDVANDMTTDEASTSANRRGNKPKRISNSRRLKKSSKVPVKRRNHLKQEKAFSRVSNEQLFKELPKHNGAELNETAESTLADSSKERNSNESLSDHLNGIDTPHPSPSVQFMEIVDRIKSLREIKGLPRHNTADNILRIINLYREMTSSPGPSEREVLYLFCKLRKRKEDLMKGCVKKSIALLISKGILRQNSDGSLVATPTLVNEKLELGREEGFDESPILST